MDVGTVSVIAPVYNGGASWGRCLDALAAANPAPYEVIVVDDGSNDDSREQAAARGFTVLQTDKARSGPAAARNLGAHRARGEILFFVDADVMIPPDAIGCIVDGFQDSRVSAIFGSYDDAPSESAFVSQYKNLMHHYVHQTSQSAASSFWAGCGAIRKHVFEQMGGFSAAYLQPSIEDIELGYRLRRANYRIYLMKELQVTHLKRWTFRSLLATDVLNRAVPWARLILRERELPADLNLKLSDRLSTLLCFLLVAAPVGLLLSPLTLLVFPLLIASLVALNFDLYRFFYNKRGLWFCLRAVPLHWFYYLYSGAAFGVVLLLTVGQSLAGIFSVFSIPRPETKLPR
jgi:glycosyltransferase involved in cell wall biosynthesis